MLLTIGRLAVLRSVPGDQNVSALAFISTAGQIGPIVGPTLGGWFVEAISWHWIFLVNVPIGAISMFAVHRYLRDRHAFDAVPVRWPTMAANAFRADREHPVARHTAVQAVTP